MKIRQGFVSNSSSSSFVIFGRYLDDSLPNHRDLYELGILYYESEDGPCVGVSPSEMRLNETLLEFSERVAKKLSDAGIPSSPGDFHFTGGTYMN